MPARTEVKVGGWNHSICQTEFVINGFQTQAEGSAPLLAFVACWPSYAYRDLHALMLRNMKGRRGPSPSLAP